MLQLTARFLEAILIFVFFVFPMVIYALVTGKKL